MNATPGSAPNGSDQSGQPGADRSKPAKTKPGTLAPLNGARVRMGRELRGMKPRELAASLSAPDAEPVTTAHLAGLEMRWGLWRPETVARLCAALNFPPGFFQESLPPPLDGRSLFVATTGRGRLPAHPAELLVATDAEDSADDGTDGGDAE